MNSDDTYRVFCAYGPHYNAPGCGWETEASSKREAEQLATRHSHGQTHHAEFERSAEAETDRTEGQQ